MRYKNLLLSLVFLSFSAAIVAGFKLFSWTLFLSFPGVNLESISAVLAGGGVFAFFFGPLIVGSLGVRYSTFVAFLSCLLGLLFL